MNNSKTNKLVQFKLVYKYLVNLNQLNIDWTFVKISKF